MLDTGERQNRYNLNIGIEYISNGISEISHIDVKQIASYSISKDSEQYNHNIHLLNLTQISILEYNFLKDTTNWVTIEVLENGISISDKRFKIENLVTVGDTDGLYAVQLILISELVYLYTLSHEFAKSSRLGTTEISTYITAYQLLSNILKDMVNDPKNKMKSHANTLGTTKFLYQSIRIPEKYNNLEIFSYLFTHFPPYILNPYLILDDFHITGSGKDAPYNMIITNLCNIGGYELKNTRTIKRWIPINTNFVGTEPLINYQEIRDKLESTLVIKNEIENSIFELQPEATSRNNGQIINEVSNLDITNYIRRLHIKKQLVDYKASIETYTYEKMNLEDIQFLSTYNINGVYDHIPIVIDIDFKKNQYNRFWMSTTVSYAKVPC